jgi:hypothetical protein
MSGAYWEAVTNGRLEAEVAGRYFAAFCFDLASAMRSVFFRRLARFLALSLPLLFPIKLNLRPSVALWQWSEWDEQHRRSEADWH